MICDGRLLSKGRVTYEQMAGQFLSDQWAARGDYINIISVAEAQLLLYVSKLYVSKPGSLSSADSSVLRSSSAIT